jgi:hypothetical protein
MKGMNGSAGGQWQRQHRTRGNRKGLDESVRYDIVQMQDDVWLVRRNGIDTARRSNCLGALSLAIQLARTEWVSGSVVQAMVRERGADGLWRLSVAFGTQDQCPQEEGSVSGTLPLT